MPQELVSPEEVSLFDINTGATVMLMSVSDSPDGGVCGSFKVDHLVESQAMLGVHAVFADIRHV